MVKRLPLLTAATKVSLLVRVFAGHALRRNRPGHRMSTFEAVTQALAILEGEAVARPLLEFYRRAVDRMLLVSGQINLGDVYGGLNGPRAGGMLPSCEPGRGSVGTPRGT